METGIEMGSGDGDREGCVETGTEMGMGKRDGYEDGSEMGMDGGGGWK